MPNRIVLVDIQEELDKDSKRMDCGEVFNEIHVTENI